METTHKIDQYEKQALDFCKKHNVQIHVVKSGTVQGFPNCKHDRHMTHIRNRVKITTALGSFGFYFYGSYADWQYGRKATPYQILADIACYIYTPDNFNDFCAEYGYDDDSMSAFRVFKGSRKMSDNLHKYFTEEQLTDLAEIQ